MIPTHVVKILDLIDPDDPVLASKGLLYSVQNGSDFWHLNTTDSVHGLSGREESVVIVV